VTPPYINISLNYALIRERTTDLGLGDEMFADLIGVRREYLEADLDQRAVSLTLLIRLSRLLGLTLDQLSPRRTNRRRPRRPTTPPTRTFCCRWCSPTTASASNNCSTC
jgi:hypothetical protein